MAARKQTEKQIKCDDFTVEEIVKELNLSDDKTIFIHKYGSAMSEDICGTVDELIDDYKKKKIMLVNKCYGGVKYNYSAWLFIIK